MGLSTLEDVLYHEVKDLLSAEKQFRDALPKLAKAAEDRELQDAFERHHEETINQIARLEKCFKLLGRAERSEKCEAAAGITKEGESVIEEEGESPAKDVMLAAAGRKTEHYEIASYEDAVVWAQQLNQQDIASLLTETLREERAASEKLQRIGERLASQS
jgi:ferritin-like metal-binding protein YciE